MFKSSDYLISPFELESVLIEHPAVAEAAVVPSPDPMRLAMPKVYVALAPDHQPTMETARSILRYAGEQLAPYKRIRRIEFADLPKTISGKIRRVELRGREDEMHGPSADPAAEPSTSTSKTTSLTRGRSRAPPRRLRVAHLGKSDTLRFFIGSSREAQTSHPSSAH